LATKSNVLVLVIAGRVSLLYVGWSSICRRPWWLWCCVSSAMVRWIVFWRSHCARRRPASCHVCHHSGSYVLSVTYISPLWSLSHEKGDKDLC